MATMEVPDAPWIREAERNGYPSSPPVECPCCGKDCTTVYKDAYGDVFACNWCVEIQDADEWAEEQRESSRPDWEE